MDKRVKNIANNAQESLCQKNNINNKNIKNIDKIRVFRGSKKKNKKIFDERIIFVDDIKTCDFAIFLNKEEKKIAHIYDIKEIKLYLQNKRIRFDKSEIKYPTGARYFIKQSIYFAIKIIANILPNNDEKTQFDLVIISHALMGDYVLLRNFFSDFKKQYNNIAIVTSKANLTIAKLDFEEKNIFTIESNFAKNPLSAIKFLKNLKSIKSNKVFNVMYSRDIESDLIAKFIDSKNKYCIDGDASNAFVKNLKKGNKYYNFKIDAEPYPVFEFERNKQSVSHFLDSTLFTKLSLFDKIDEIIESSTMKINDEFIAFCVGASNSIRKYMHYDEVIDYCLKNYHHKIVILGSKNDIFESKIKDDRIINLVGKTTLFDLIKLVHECALLISNETGVVHIANALNKKSIVLSNGFHFMRFNLPQSYENYKTIAIYPPYFLKRQKSNTILCNLVNLGLFKHDIADINYQDIVQNIHSLMKE